MNDDNDKKETYIMKATRLLQGKVGTGSVNKKAIEKSQKVMDEQSVDFTPMAEEYLKNLKLAIKDALQNKDKKDNQELIEGLIDPVMQIKANAAMFNFKMVGDLAEIMLNFLEAIDTIDDGVMEITEAHYKTIDLLIANNMSGDCGEYGQELETELKDACKRYFAKIDAVLAPDADAFFIDD